MPPFLQNSVASFNDATSSAVAIIVALLLGVCISQHVAAVFQDEAFQWAGHRFKHRKYWTLPHDVCVMDLARPTNNTVHDAGIGVTYQLHVYRVVIFPVDVFVLVNGRDSDLNVRAIDATDNVRKVRHGMEHDFHGFRLALWVEANVSRHKSSEGCSHSVFSSRNGCLAYTKQITNYQLETSTHKESQRDKNLERWCQ